MISPAFARTMAAYNSEMNRRMFGASARLSDEERRADRGAFWFSIHGTLNHVLWADRTWMSRFGVCEGPGIAIKDSATMVADFDDLWTQRRDADGLLADWAAELGPDAFEGELSWYSGALGRDVTKPKAIVVMQIFNHQTHHRGQVHALLTRAGETTGDTDLPFVLPAMEN